METRAMLSAMWRSRTGPILVAAQVAITLALIVNVAYIINQRLATISEPTGMDVDNIFWLRSQAYSPDYNHEPTVRADLAYLNGLPGVVAASTTSMIPQSFSTSVMGFSDDPAKLEKGAGELAIIYFGSDRFLETLGLKLVAGRTFDPAAVVRPGADWKEMLGNLGPEVVITRNLAKKIWPPDGNALGKTLNVGMVNKGATIVGIVDQMQHMPISGPASEMFHTIAYFPALAPGPSTAYMVRTQPGRRDATMARVEKEMGEMQPGRYIASMEAFSDTVRRMRAGARTSVITLGVVAVFVAAVTAVGIVGLAAFTVASRTKQLGTRRAIGATKFHILRYFLVENWLITSIGALLGCALALGVGIKLSAIYQMPRLPLLYLLGGAVALWALGLLAVWIPARRAASISPAVATRTV